MERKRKIIAALADLRQDFAGPIPLDLAAKWFKSDQTEADQKTILAPYEKEGYLVSSDSAGLSRLTAERTLIEVMNIVSIPKEIIYAHGLAIGGRGVGVWFADNSMMFYGADLAAENILNQMAAAQKKIHQQLLQVGLSVHYGKFWEIGGSMFGDDADILEESAENHTAAKEIILSQTVREKLSVDLQSKMNWREDLDFAQKFYSLNYDDLGAGAKYKIDYNYPIPFSKDFYKALKHYGITQEAESLVNKHFLEKAVILIKVRHKKDGLLLKQLTDWSVMSALMSEIAVKYDVELVKNNGDLGIYLANSDQEILNFAEDVLISLKATEDQVSIGVARGEVLVFELDGGSKDIAGGAVNIASKISEDVSGQNTLYVHDSVKMNQLEMQKYEPFDLQSSRVSIKGKRYIS